MLPTVEDGSGYDFQDPQNAEKWRGMFVNSLKKVLEVVHPSLRAEEEALQYVENLCLRLLASLCAAPSPLTVQDVEERVARTFPTPIDKWALTEAKDAVAQRRKRLLLPHDKVHHMLKEVLPYKVDGSISVFMTAILEYISCDILKLAGNFVKKIPQKSALDSISSRDVETAMCADKVLMDMFYQESEPHSSETPTATDATSRRASLTYAELVRDLVTDERHFLRDLNLIIRVFKDKLEAVIDHETTEKIFGNIMDIYELTVTLLGNLEDAMEMAQGEPTPYIGTCFEELAEVEEFRAYARYASAVTTKESRDTLQAIVDDPALAERLDTAGHGFRLSVKYYLPKLILSPVYHILVYHDYVLRLLRSDYCSGDDRESFRQVDCNLLQIKRCMLSALQNGPKIEQRELDRVLGTSTRDKRQDALSKCTELAKQIDNWDTRDIGQCCNEFIREDTLSKITPGKRNGADRRAYLFDGLLLLCKPVTSLVAVAPGTALSSISGGPQYKLKEKLYIRKLVVVDRPDTDDLRHALELQPREGAAVILCCSSCHDKRSWMGDLIQLNTKPMLDRTLDSILMDLEKKHPLKLPPPELYRFAVPDSTDNIIFEDRHEKSQVPIIKGGTLLKLVERLTYHIYVDLSLVRTFLTTYRSFCSPLELLELLIERWNMPEPTAVYTATDVIEGSTDADKLCKTTVREDFKRYRKEFQQPVKFRVINVLRHWTDQHFYDFERDPSLLDKLRAFLTSVHDKPMRKWVSSVLKILTRKSLAGDAEGVSHVFEQAPPSILRNLACPHKYNWHILALHPVELARQATALHFALYRQVKPSELVGSVWTKRGKETSSPNLLRISKHTTNFTVWIMKSIVETENLEERVGVACRFIEVAQTLNGLNNFNGVLAVVAAFESSAVYRLKNTFALIPLRLIRALEDYKTLNQDHYKKYQERLRSINPPCVPFFGMYLTNILHIEEGNKDFIPNTKLINFSKRRMVAEITGEIQQYQNQPYCLKVEPDTRAFLESLNPFPDMEENEYNDYLYQKSLEIEPRPPAKQPTKFPRRFPELPLKPLKTRRRETDNSHHSTSSNDDSGLPQLSPTNNWDTASLNVSFHDDNISMHSMNSTISSPRSERNSLLDKGLALFDKTKSSHRSNSIREEPSSPRDRHSPRHEARQPVTDRRPTSATSPRVTSIVDHDDEPASPQEAVPPLLPRTMGRPRTEPRSDPPQRPPRSASPQTSPTNTSSCGASPNVYDVYDRPSPKADMVKAASASPKRSPFPPPSPLQRDNSDRTMTFNFPSKGASAPSTPPPGSALSSTPPPLPPRRRTQPPPSPAVASVTPPPVPPRPTSLLRPAHSALLQRRHNTQSSLAPELPPKPSAALAPRT